MLTDLYAGYKKLRRRPDQLITAIRIPRQDYAFQLFVKVGPRRAQAIAKVGVAITRSDRGWRVVANSVAPVVCRCSAIEALLTEATPVRSPEDLIPTIRQDVAPIDDIRSTARYRELTMARVLYYGLRGVCSSFT